jgi:hypothetical protein
LRDKNIYVFVYAFHISWSALCSGIVARHFGDTIPKLAVGIKALGSQNQVKGNHNRRFGDISLAPQTLSCGKRKLANDDERLRILGPEGYVL